MYGGGNDSDLKLIHTLVSGNTAPTGREVFTYDAHYVTVDRFNLFGHSGDSGVTGFQPGQFDLVPNQGPDAIRSANLANNGGPTRNHALVAGSPAIYVVNDGTCPPPASDQRSVARAQDGDGNGGVACDVGSFERQ